MLRASWILFTAHLWRTLRSKRAIFCALIVVFPMAAAFAVAQVSRFEGPPPADFLPVPYFLILQTCAPLVSLLLGSAVVAEEIEDRTISYLLTRPIPRASILIGRYLATLFVLFLILGTSATFAAHWLGEAAARSEHSILPQGFDTRFVLTVLMGGVVYAALFAALGAWTKWPVIVGLAYTFVIEVVLANVPGKGQNLTIQYYLKSFLFGGDASLIENAEFLTSKLLPPAEALRSLALIALFALGVGSWILSRRQFLLPS